jgi:hypothetical protein
MSWRSAARGIPPQDRRESSRPARTGGHASARSISPADRAPRAPGAERLGKPSPDLPFGRWRKRVEHGQMRRHPVALGRIVLPAQSVEPGEIGFAQFGGDDQRAGQWSGSSASSAQNCERRWAVTRSRRRPCSLRPGQAPKRFADPGHPAFRDHEIGDPPARAAGHRVDAAAELLPRGHDLAFDQQRYREQGFAGRVRLSLAAAIAPSSIRACRPSQRQTPNRLRKVRTTFCHSRLGWSVAYPRRPGDRADREDDEADSR